jgi:hypothetical protein
MAIDDMPEMCQLSRQRIELGINLSQLGGVYIFVDMSELTKRRSDVLKKLNYSYDCSARRRDRTRRSGEAVELLTRKRLTIADTYLA